MGFFKEPVLKNPQYDTEKNSLQPPPQFKQLRYKTEPCSPKFMHGVGERTLPNSLNSNMGHFQRITKFALKIRKAKDAIRVILCLCHYLIKTMLSSHSQWTGRRKTTTKKNK